MEGWDATASEAGKVAAARQPVIEAERLFANLTGQAEGRDADGRPPPVLPSTVAEAPPAATPEVVDLVRAALDATDRIAEVVDDLGATVDATAVDVAALGRAIEQALAATNERLAFVEHILLDESAPGVEASEQAMARLRRTLRRSSERSEGGAG